MCAEKSSSDEPKWKLIERIVALLEQSLTPDAKVEHNVFLPVIGIPRDKRQCDVVITYGRAPRTMVAIVEVQDRSKSVEINDFNGWTTKMNEVGAHMLICVSERDFPTSIKNRVLLQHGEKVKLLTLKELNEPDILKMKLCPKALFRSLTFNIISVGMMKVGTSNQLPDGAEMRIEIHSSDDKVFEWDKSHDRQSLNDLVSFELRNLDLRYKTVNLQPGATLDIDINICHDESENVLWLHQGEQEFKVRDLPMKVAIGIKESMVSVKCYSYKQELIDDVIAWVSSARAVIGDKTHEFQLVFHPADDGTLHLVSVRQTVDSILNLFIGFPDEATAMTEFRRIFHENPDPALAWYNSGVILHNSGMNEEAIVAYDNAIKINPKIAMVWNNKGAALHNLRRNEEAISAYEKAIEMDSTYSDPWYNKGNILREMDHHEEAIIAYDNAIKINPKHIQALSNKAMSLLKLKRFDDAIETCEKATKLDSKYLSAWGIRGVSLYESGKPEDALKAYEEVLTIDPRQAETWYNRGNALLIIGNFEDSITAYDKAIELKPEYEDAWNNRGNALRGLGRYEEAITAYENALKANHKLMEAWYNMGLTLENVGRNTEAEAAFAKAKELGYPF